MVREPRSGPRELQLHGKPRATGVRLLNQCGELGAGEPRWVLQPCSAPGRRERGEALRRMVVTSFVGSAQGA